MQLSYMISSLQNWKNQKNNYKPRAWHPNSPPPFWKNKVLVSLCLGCQKLIWVRFGKEHEGLYDTQRNSVRPRKPWAQQKQSHARENAMHGKRTRSKPHHRMKYSLAHYVNLRSWPLALLNETGNTESSLPNPSDLS